MHLLDGSSSRGLTSPHSCGRSAGWTDVPEVLASSPFSLYSHENIYHRRYSSNTTEWEWINKHVQTEHKRKTNEITAAHVWKSKWQEVAVPVNTKGEMCRSVWGERSMEGRDGRSRKSKRERRGRNARGQPSTFITPSGGLEFCLFHQYSATSFSTWLPTPYRNIYNTLDLDLPESKPFCVQNYADAGQSPVRWCDTSDGCDLPHWLEEPDRDFSVLPRPSNSTILEPKENRWDHIDASVGAIDPPPHPHQIPTRLISH